MSNDTDTVRIYFPADIPRDQAKALASLFTGQDDDVLLSMEEAVNDRIDKILPDRDFFEKVEFSAPFVMGLGFQDRGDKDEFVFAVKEGLL